MRLDILVNANLLYTGRCFGHVVNIANVAIMGHITRIAAVENATAIWEYDPDLPGNRVLGGSLDVIASIRTIAIKVSAIIFTVIICSLFHYHFIRYRLLDNELNISKNYKFNARLLTHSKSHSIATFDGGRHTLCCIALICYAR
jgi:hypothetical protein